MKDREKIQSGKKDVVNNNRTSSSSFMEIICYCPSGKHRTNIPGINLAPKQSHRANQILAIFQQLLPQLLFLLYLVLTQCEASYLCWLIQMWKRQICADLCFYYSYYTFIIVCGWVGKFKHFLQQIKSGMSTESHTFVVY